MFPLGPFGRYAGNPILGPRGTSWEAKDVFNPAAVVREGKVHLLYRAEDVSGEGRWNGTSRIGLATSDDGFAFERRSEPVIYPTEPYEKPGGCEDPRVAEIEGTYYATYTAFGGDGYHLCLATSVDLVSWEKHGILFTGWTGGRGKASSKAGAILKEPVDGRYVMYFGDANVWVAYSEDLIHWTPVEEPVFGRSPDPDAFDGVLVEPGPQPLMTDEGILLIYNAAQDIGGRLRYSAGQVLLSGEDPGRVIRRTPEPFFAPEEPGELAGQVDEVVFLEGLVRHRGTYFLYYGMADSEIGAATCRPAGKGGALFEAWKLGDFAPGEGVAAGAFGERFDDADWLDITAPGDVHRALIDAGRIEDPFYDRNEEKCAWIEDREWWYRTTFDGPEDSLGSDERLRLVFHGLDTFATIWLNGEELGDHANMFREAAFDVTDRVKQGPNTLALCFHRPLERAVPGPAEQWGRNPERVGMRKAQFGYGWDWGPRLPTVGIWRPVELRRERRAAVRGVHAYTLEIAPDHQRALLAVKVEAERFVPSASPTARIELRHPHSGDALEKTVELRGDGDVLEGAAYLEVEDPALWWTHDLGDPALYGLRVVLEEDGEELDERGSRIGVRTVELDQSPDPEEPGTRFFRFVLNGVPIFARGADWAPADSFVGAIPDRRYESLIGAARDANMNMLRIWGGGIYEHDAFYDLCDALGILVWQDFMFACATYPEQPPEFVAEVEAEARYQVSRLRSHPCLALWCGNNENQWIHDRAHPENTNNRVPGALYYHEVLPRVVAELDGRTPYWPGSPFGGDDHNDRRQGNVHNWEVWHGNRPFGRRFGQQNERDDTPEGVSYLNYAKDTGRFISEFGMHAAPVRETLRRAIPEDQLYHHSPSMDHHNKDDPKNKGDNLMESVTGLPNGLDEYVDFSMISQAEGLKFALEHFRRRKPHCSGTLFWQLNDCWPVLSWSVLDHNGFGKAGYYYARRAYAPVLASFKALDDGSVELWISNDTLSATEDTATVRLARFDGATVWEETLPARVPANASAAVARWDAARVEGGPDAYLSVSSSGATFPRNRHFFAAIKDLRRKPVAPEVGIEQVSEHELRVDLRAEAYAYFVHLDVPDEATRFSDNFFDLEPGERRSIVVTNTGTALTPDAVEVGWR